MAPLGAAGVLLAALACSCGGEKPAGADDGARHGAIVIATANSLTGALAPFEVAINGGMDVAADDINRAGGVDGRRVRIVHVDAKSDLNLSATATLQALEKGADVVVPMCDADLGGPGARAANAEGILAITCAGGPGLGRKAIGPLTFNTYTGSPTESAINAEYAYREKGWRTAYVLCDRLLEYSKVACEAFKTRWKELGGELVGEDAFLQSDASIAAQVTRLKSARQPDVVMLASFPAGSPALKQIRAAYSGPIMLTASFSGTFWLKATPGLSNVWVPAFGSSYGDDPRPEINAFFDKYARRTGKAAVVDSYPILGYSTVQTIAKGVEMAGTTDGRQLGKALDGFRDVDLLAGSTTYTSSCHIPVGREMLMIEYRDGRPRSTGDFVKPEKVPAYPC
jgi:branched-chain amino acid transport system substrate-binding protein